MSVQIEIMTANGAKASGGYTNYAIRGATLVQDYFPGPMRQNLLLDPDLSIGKFDRGKTIMKNQMYNGPGTLLQSRPDPSRFQSNWIFAEPSSNPFRFFGQDDRQIAEYQVEQLQNNPLSQYTNNPNGVIPGFECMTEPDNFSTGINKRESDYKTYFDFYVDPQSVSVVDWSGSEPVYGAPKNSVYNGGSEGFNPNAAIVYNMSMNSAEQVNPMIALGSSNVMRTGVSDFSGLCYSGNFVPTSSQLVGSAGSGPTGSVGPVGPVGPVGQQAPSMYNNNTILPRERIDQGFVPSHDLSSNTICLADRSLIFANPLVINDVRSYNADSIKGPYSP